MKIVIIGGSDAGISAALRIRELDKTIEPLIITSDEFPNFSICGIPFYIGDEIKDWRTLAHRTRAEIEGTGIKLLLDTVVTKILPEEKKIYAAPKDGKPMEIKYDRLVIGTGATSAVPPIEGRDLPGVFYIRWIGESVAFKEYMEKNKPQNAVIIGAGYIGIEMSEALLNRGIGITVVEFLNTVLPTMDVQLGNLVMAKLEEKGAKVFTGVSVSAIKQNNKKLDVTGSNGFSASTDLVLIATGAVPNTKLAMEAGVKTDQKNAIIVNRKMETNIPDIFAAGDCVETWNRITQKYVYLPLGTISHKQGRIAGENALGNNVKFEGTLGTQSLKLFDMVMARTGLNDREATGAGFEPFTSEFEAWDHKVYYPSATKISIRMTGDRKTGRLLGFQMIGSRTAEISKRIDIAAAAIYNSMTISALSSLDLSYTPPLSTPWDPVQMAGQDWMKKV